MLEESEKEKHEVVKNIKFLKLSTMIYGIIIVISADLWLEFMNSLYDLVRRINLRGIFSDVSSGGAMEKSQFSKINMKLSSMSEA